MKRTLFIIVATLICVLIVSSLFFVFTNSGTEELSLEDKAKKEFAFIQKGMSISKISEVLNQEPIKLGSGILYNIYGIKKDGIVYDLHISSVTNPETVEFAEVIVSLDDNANNTTRVVLVPVE